MKMNKETQLQGSYNINQVKPEVSRNGIFFPVSAEVVNLDKYHGDARSFGYNFDEGTCTVVKYEQVVGALAEDTIALFDECAEMKEYMKKPHHSILETADSDAECNTGKAELLIRYDSEYFYKDEHGYFFSNKYFNYGKNTRVTDESAEIYREVNKEYQRMIVEYNKIMKVALDNMKQLSTFVNK